MVLGGWVGATANASRQKVPSPAKEHILLCCRPKPRLWRAPDVPVPADPPDRLRHLPGGVRQLLRGASPLPPACSLAPLAPSGGAAAPDAEHLRGAQAKRQEIVVAKGAVLELLRPDDNGKVQVIHSTQVFGVVRALANFRLTGAQAAHPPPALGAP